ncbi:MAG: hypothetical protein EXQ70_00470 [Solirubrobacterales bacterium]|nr:hypothetical protein [Solirubrobacterales bacterium]
MAEQVRNPLRNEADAFRFLMMCVGAAAVVIVVALLLGSLAGVLVAIAFLIVGAWRTWGMFDSWRRLGSDPDRAPDRD